MEERRPYYHSLLAIISSIKNWKWRQNFNVSIKNWTGCFYEGMWDIEDEISSWWGFSEERAGFNDI